MADRVKLCFPGRGTGCEIEVVERGVELATRMRRSIRPKRAIEGQSAPD